MNSMRGRAIPALLCCAALSGAGAVQAQAESATVAAIPAQGDDMEPAPPDIASYELYIDALENRGGPYARGLSEQLLGLGAAYQHRGLHGEAIGAFKRGVHVARINNGLHGPAQIPLLQGLIKSLVASGDFETADERQYYLYRIQRGLYGENSEQMSRAMLERAAWERQAYHLALGDAAFTRLLTIWDLYSRAVRSITGREGKTSPELLEPLNGLLLTRYMISTYSDEFERPVFGENMADPRFAEKNRFGVVRASNYKQGRAVIEAMREVHDHNEDEQSPLRAETWVQLGDWHLWHGKPDSALAAYQRAWDELAALENGADEQRLYFGQPVLLPDTPDFPHDKVSPANIRGYAEVSYYISPRGRVKELQLLKTEAVNANDDVKPIQLLRQIRRNQYRPRLVNREPVATEVITTRHAF